jgi:hypothetical protein
MGARFPAGIIREALGLLTAVTTGVRLFRFNRRGGLTRGFLMRRISVCKSTSVASHRFGALNTAERPILQNTASRLGMAEFDDGGALLHTTG